MIALPCLGEIFVGNVRILTLPPYSLELNPVEKLWNIMKDSLCNRVYGTQEEVERAITEVLKGGASLF